MLSYSVSFSFDYHLVSHLFLTGTVVTPASQLKHGESSAVPGFVLQLLAMVWGNASLAEFCCSPITTFLLPHPFCLAVTFDSVLCLVSLT